MRIQDAYRLALARNLTAKEAGAVFGFNHEHLAKCKGRHDLPSLVTQAEKADREAISKMSDKDLRDYINVLELNKFHKNKEYKYATDERTLRAKRNQEVL